MIAVQDMDVINAITKVLYPQVAKNVRDHAVARRAGHSPRHRGCMGQRRSRNAPALLRLYRVEYEGQADKFRVYCGAHCRQTPTAVKKRTGDLSDVIQPLPGGPMPIFGAKRQARLRLETSLRACRIGPAVQAVFTVIYSEFATSPKGQCKHRPLTNKPEKLQRETDISFPCPAHARESADALPGRFFVFRVIFSCVSGKSMV